jgi:hypothetical protein
VREQASRSKAVTKAAGVVALLFLAAVAISPGALGTDGGPIRILGKLPNQPAINQRQFSHIVQLDVARRRMYYVYTDLSFVAHMVEYDIAPTMPRALRSSVLQDFPSGTFSANLTAYDTKRRMMSFIDVYQSPVGTTLRRFSVSTFHMEPKPWDLATKVPGFIASGITYAPQDDRIYLVGDLSASGSVHDANAGIGGVPQGPVAAVVALEAGTGAVAWIKPITQCAQVLSDFAAGGFIGRSARRDAIYFFCYSGSSQGVEIAYPAQTGLVRLGIGGAATQNDALNFPVEYFPVSGSYRGGAGVGGLVLDERSDRLFVQSLSQVTPGAWGFDGNISAWVGLIAAPDPNDYYQAVSSSNGHYYMAAHESSEKDRYLLVSNSRLTPPPQGDVFRLPVDGPIVVDPMTHRIFLELQKDGENIPTIYVALDQTPDPEPEEPVDYDNLTSDVAEGPNTLSTYAATLGGFGARAFIVGGAGGARSAFNGGNLGPEYDELVDQYIATVGAPVPVLTPGDRGLYFARVVNVDLRNSGAAATAQAVVPDTLTDSDIQNAHYFVEGSPAQPAAAALVWPYPAATCLDGSGDAIGQDQPESGTGNGGEAHVKCNLKDSITTGSAKAATVTVGPITIGSSTFEATSTRDKAKGSIAEATATAKGIEIKVEGLGTVHIGLVTAIARTVAHGRPGTAKVEYDRMIRDVRIVSASGEETFKCAAVCEESDVASQINGLIGSKVRMDIPKPDELATARGAFAGVKKGEAEAVGGQAQNNDYLSDLPAVQFTINNDSAAKSRVLVQLAGVRASSIYGISLLGDFGGPDGGFDLPPTVVQPPEIPPIVDGTQFPPIVQNPGTGPVAIGFRGGFLLARTPKEVLIVGLIFALIAATVVAAYRRTALIARLEEESR